MTADVGNLISIQGSVKIQRERTGEMQDILPANLPLHLLEGDRLITGADCYVITCTLASSCTSSLVVFPDTEVSLVRQPSAGVEVRLKSGLVRVGGCVSVTTVMGEVALSEPTEQVTVASGRDGTDFFMAETIPVSVIHRISGTTLRVEPFIEVAVATSSSLEKAGLDAVPPAIMERKTSYLTVLANSTRAQQAAMINGLKATAGTDPVAEFSKGVAALDSLPPEVARQMGISQEDLLKMREQSKMALEQMERPEVKAARRKLSEISLNNNPSPKLTATSSEISEGRGGGGGKIQPEPERPKVLIEIASGESVSVLRGGSTLPVPTTGQGTGTALQSGDRIITGARSAVLLLKDTPPSDSMDGTTITLFPESECQIEIAGREKGMISRVIPIRGLFRIFTAIGVVNGFSSFMEFQGDPSQRFAGWIEIPDSQTVIIESSLALLSIRHIPSGKSILADVIKTIRVTPSALYNPRRHEPRIAAAEDAYMKMMQAFSARSLPSPETFATGADSAGREIRAQFASRVAELESSLNNTSLSKKGRGEIEKELAAMRSQLNRVDQDIEKYQQKRGAYKAQVASQVQKAQSSGLETFSLPLPPYLPLTDTDLADTRDVTRTAPDINELVRRASEAGVQGVSPAVGMGNTNELAAYVKKRELALTAEALGVKILIKGMEKGPEHRLRKSPKGQDFLLVTLVFENSSANDAFLSPDQEMWLITDGVSTPLPPDNYYFDTRIDSKGRTEGSLLFIVPQQASRFTLQFGKKTLPKVDVTLTF